ncbi:MAG TPA: GntR family transcriptional regulator [Vicinamibacterales bacterium]|nr:GntR family transcriptional regulator [Vicinamibacterales bacterium]
MLPFTIALHAGEPVYEQVTYAVKQAVVTGQLRAGDAFPSVRELSRELKINPNTGHRIVALLVDEGLLTVRPGIGTVVGAGHPADPAERRRVLVDAVERLVVEGRHAGVSLADLIAAIRRAWSQTNRKAG